MHSYPFIQAIPTKVAMRITLNDIDGLVQERRNSSALAMELRLSCTNPSMCANNKLKSYVFQYKLGSLQKFNYHHNIGLQSGVIGELSSKNIPWRARSVFVDNATFFTFAIFTWATPDAITAASRSQQGIYGVFLGFNDEYECTNLLVVWRTTPGNNLFVGSNLKSLKIGRWRFPNDAVTFIEGCDNMRFQQQ